MLRGLLEEVGRLLEHVLVGGGLVARSDGARSLLGRARCSALGRPLVDRIASSRLHNLKELRISVAGHELRVLFVFDPRRVAVLLLGGDKTGAWAAWYATAIPEAERLYDELIGELHDEGLLEDPG